LGIEFVTALYGAIAEDENSFGFVAIEDDKVLGFIAFSTNLNKLYKSIILKRGLRFAFLLAGKMFSLERIKRTLETLFYPGRTKGMNLPSAEVLSIAVASQSCGKGFACQLIEKRLQECYKRGLDKVKVLVGADNTAVNKLYLKCGFELVEQINNHGVLSNIYVTTIEKPSK
jgi:ribosomal protein S18 acetylase RimI-like enzyme